MTNLDLISCQVIATRNFRDRNTKITRAMPMDVMINWNHECKMAVVLLDTEWIIRKCLFLSSPLITNTVTGLGIDSCRECNMEEMMLDWDSGVLNSHTTHITHYLWNLGIHFMSSTKYIIIISLHSQWDYREHQMTSGMKCYVNVRVPLFWSSKPPVTQTDISILGWESTMPLEFFLGPVFLCWYKKPSCYLETQYTTCYF